MAKEAWSEFLDAVRATGRPQARRAGREPFDLARPGVATAQHCIGTSRCRWARKRARLAAGLPPAVRASPFTGTFPDVAEGRAALRRSALARNVPSARSCSSKSAVDKSLSAVEGAGFRSFTRLTGSVAGVVGGPSRKARPSVFAGPHTAPVAVRRSPEGRAEPFLLPTPSPGRPAPEVSVIIPVHEEQENVRPLCETVVHALEELGRTWEMIVVDDGSRDETYPRLTAL